MYAGGLSYLSICFLVRGFHSGVCPEAVAIDTIKTTKIDRVLAAIAEDLIRYEVVGALKR
jgi:hypothetical protein